MKNFGKIAGNLIYAGRWLLFPMGVGMLLILFAYVLAFFVYDVKFLFHNFRMDMESWALFGLNFVDAYMIGNLMLMVAQGSFQIFIQRFELEPENRAQYLDHLDSGLLKVKVSQSIGGIMFIQLLVSFVNIHNELWIDVEHRLIVTACMVVFGFIFAAIWRVTHPAWQNGKHEEH